VFFAALLLLLLLLLLNARLLWRPRLIHCGVPIDSRHVARRSHHGILCCTWIQSRACGRIDGMLLLLLWRRRRSAAAAGAA
jgi:hypothetical protein